MVKLSFMQVDDYLNSVNNVNGTTVYDKMVASLSVETPEVASELVMA